MAAFIVLASFFLMYGIKDIIVGKNSSKEDKVTEGEDQIDTDNQIT